MSACRFLRGAAIAAALASGLVLAAPVLAAEGVTVLIAYHSVTGNTEKMARGVAEGAAQAGDATTILKKIGDVTADDLLAADAVVIGSPVYFANMAGDVKAFFDSWAKMGLFQGRKMRNKVGAAFATGGSPSSGKELTIVGIHAAMLVNRMVIASGGGGLGATATTGSVSPGIDEQELAEATALGKRVAEIAAIMKRGSSDKASAKRP
jgi:NAD(P)H dehydrogenase (quinone)